MLNPGYARALHIISAGFVFFNACANAAAARKSSPDVALNPSLVGSELKAGLYPRRPFAQFQVASRSSPTSWLVVTALVVVTTKPPPLLLLLLPLLQ